MKATPKKALTHHQQMENVSSAAHCRSGPCMNKAINQMREISCLRNCILSSSMTRPDITCRYIPKIKNKNCVWHHKQVSNVVTKKCECSLLPSCTFLLIFSTSQSLSLTGTQKAKILCSSNPPPIYKKYRPAMLILISNWDRVEHMKKLQQYVHMMLTI